MERDQNVHDDTTDTTKGSSPWIDVVLVVPSWLLDRKIVGRIKPPPIPAAAGPRSTPTLRRPGPVVLGALGDLPAYSKIDGRSSATRPAGCFVGIRVSNSLTALHARPPLRASLKNCLHVFRNFRRQLRARFVQAQHHAGQLQSVVQPLVHQADRLQAASTNRGVPESVAAGGRKNIVGRGSALIVRMPSDGGQSIST